MIAAEVFGTSETGRIVDLGAPSSFTPAYAVYERDRISKFALSVVGGVPASVRVKYFLADSVSSKTNITWAGQVRAPLHARLLFVHKRGTDIRRQL